MNDLIQLNPANKEISEIKSVSDLLQLLKTHDWQTPRIALFKRFNLEHIRTVEDLIGIMNVLTHEELKLLYELFDTNFLKRILPLIFSSYHLEKKLNSFCALITADSFECLIPFLKVNSLGIIRQVLDALLKDDLKKMVVLCLNGLFGEKLTKSLTYPNIKKTNQPLSFKKWDEDYYEKSDWGWLEDDHADRCREIIIKIDNALYFVPLLEGIQQSSYIDTLLNLLHQIINNATELNYLLDHLSEDNQSLLMTLIIKQGISPQQIGIISKEEYIFTQWRRCTFFGKESIKNQLKLMQHSSFSAKQVRAIEYQINTLQNEINSIWPFSNKKRKKEKVIGLRTLLIKSIQMDATDAIEQIDKEYPELRKGNVSTRTKQLLENIEAEVAQEKRLKVRIGQLERLAKTDL